MLSARASGGLSDDKNKIVDINQPKVGFIAFLNHL